MISRKEKEERSQNCAPGSNLQRQARAAPPHLKSQLWPFLFPFYHLSIIIVSPLWLRSSPHLYVRETGPLQNTRLLVVLLCNLEGRDMHLHCRGQGFDSHRGRKKRDALTPLLMKCPLTVCALIFSTAVSPIKFGLGTAGVFLRGSAVSTVECYRDGSSDPVSDLKAPLIYHDGRMTHCVFK